MTLRRSACVSVMLSFVISWNNIPPLHGILIPVSDLFLHECRVDMDVANVYDAMVKLKMYIQGDTFKLIAQCSIHKMVGFRAFKRVKFSYVFSARCGHGHFATHFPCYGTCKCACMGLVPSVCMFFETCCF